MRIYSDDLERGLAAAGFDIMEPLTADHYSEAENQRYGLRVIQDGSVDAGLFCGYSTDN